MRDALELGLGERTVEVKRDDLLETLKTNKEAHKKAYEQAVKDYKEVACAELEKAFTKAKRSLDGNLKELKNRVLDDERDTPEQIILLPQIMVKLPVPQDHSRSYEVAIQMARWEVNDTVELTQSQFQCFVLDDWDWKRKFESDNATYASFRP